MSENERRTDVVLPRTVAARPGIAESATVGLETARDGGCR